jgi:hypothetical protein
MLIENRHQNDDCNSSRIVWRIVAERFSSQHVCLVVTYCVSKVKTQSAITEDLARSLPSRLLQDSTFFDVPEDFHTANDDEQDEEYEDDDKKGESNNEIAV